MIWDLYGNANWDPCTWENGAWEHMCFVSLTLVKAIVINYRPSSHALLPEEINRGLGGGHSAPPWSPV